MNKVLFEDDEDKNKVEPRVYTESPSVIPEQVPEAGAVDQLAWVINQEMSPEDNSYFKKIQGFFTSDPALKKHDESLGPRINDISGKTATIDSMGFFDQTNLAKEVSQLSPNNPSGSLSRVSGTINSYAKEVQEKTGINILDGLSSEAIARQTVGVTGNIGMSWDELLFNPIAAAAPLPFIAKSVAESVVGLRDVVDMFNSRIEAISKRYPDIKPLTVDNLFKKSIEDYNTLQEQYEQSNPDGKWLTQAGSIAGTVAGALDDPINLASTVISGGTGSLLKAIGMNAGIQGITSLPGYIEGNNQGIEGSNLANYATGVVTAGAIGGLAHGVGQFLKSDTAAAIKNKVKDFAGRFYKFVDEGISSDSPTSAIAAGSDKTSEFLSKASKKIDDDIKAMPEEAIQSKATAAEAKAKLDLSSEQIRNNPEGTSPEAVLKAKEKFARAEYNLRRGTWTLDDALSEPAIPELPNVKTGRYWEEFQGLADSFDYTKRVRNSLEVGKPIEEGQTVRFDKWNPDTTDIRGNQAELSKLGSGDVIEVPKNLRSLGTTSGNYLPRIEKDGTIKTFDSIDDALKFKESISDVTQRSRTGIGSSPEGKFTLVEDTPIREIARAKSEAEADRILKETVDSGDHYLHELSVVKEGKIYKVVSHANEADLSKISDYPGYSKINSPRKAIQALDPTPEDQAARIEELGLQYKQQQLKELAETNRMKANLKTVQDFANKSMEKQEEYLTKQLEKDLVELPDGFKYDDEIWGTFTKNNSAEKLQYIRQAIKEFIDCMGE